MINRLLRNYKLKNGLAIGFVLLVLLSSIINSYTNYVTNKDILYKEIDKELQSAAANSGLLLGEAFFQKAVTANAISHKEDMQNIKKLSLFAKNAMVEYVYAMIQKNDKIYFISSSAKDDEINTEDMTRYFDQYDEATPVLKNVLKNNKIIYETSTDKWGTFRTVFIPMTTTQGNKYILGADVKIDFIKKKLDQFVNKIIVRQLIIILILMIFAYYFVQISRKELYEIKTIKEQLDKEIEDKTEELAQLNNSLEQKVQDELNKNRKKDQQLIQQSRLAQMGEMIAMIAHQWRQPLTAISSTSHSIYIKASLDKLNNDDAIRLAKQISEYTHHLSGTIDDFRNFFKSNKDKRKTTYNELIKGALDIIETSIKNKNIILQKDLQSTVVFDTYPNELKQVVLNIIKNAEDALLEYQPANPTITITTDGETLSIGDNGGGIPEDVIDKIFDPYFSTKLTKNGTGLGLYMSKMIIEDHCKGKLTVSNNENGAVFTIKLKGEQDA